jgi:manganese-dependent inorganic pyrophosphatase
MTTLVFGHKSPDTDSTGSPLIWAWYLTDEGHPAEARPAGRAQHRGRLRAGRWGLDLPEIIADVDDGRAGA